MTNSRKAWNEGEIAFVCTICGKTISKETGSLLHTESVKIPCICQDCKKTI